MGRVARLRPALVASVAARGLPSATARTATACTATALSTARASTARTARRAGLRHRARLGLLPARHRRRRLVLLLQAAPPVEMRTGALGLLCTLQCTVRPGLWHRLRQALRRARCIPSAPYHPSNPLSRGGSFATAMCWPLTTLPTLSLTRHPSDLQAERRVRGCRRESQGNRTLLGQRQEVRQEG